MLFCMTADYTAQALNAMAENPATNRHAAASALIEAAGGKLVAMYGRAVNGPGVMVVYDVPEPDMSAAISGVVVATNALHNLSVTRLYTTDEMNAIRQKRVRIAAAYKAPGKA